MRLLESVKVHSVINMTNRCKNVGVCERDFHNKIIVFNVGVCRSEDPLFHIILILLYY